MEKKRGKSLWKFISCWAIPNPPNLAHAKNKTKPLVKSVCKPVPKSLFCAPTRVCVLVLHPMIGLLNPSTIDGCGEGAWWNRRGPQVGLEGNHCSHTENLSGKRRRYFRVVKSSRLPAKITTYLVSIVRLLCLAFLYRWCFLHKKRCLVWQLTRLLQNFLITLNLSERASRDEGGLRAKKKL